MNEKIQKFFYEIHDAILEDDKNREPGSEEHFINLGGLLMLQKYYNRFRDCFTGEQQAQLDHMYDVMSKIHGYDPPPDDPD